MKNHEPECVALKRRGAEYVANLLSGKSKQEQLAFWSQRTKRLRDLQQTERPVLNPTTVSGKEDNQSDG